MTDIERITAIEITFAKGGISQMKNLDKQFSVSSINEMVIGNSLLHNNIFLKKAQPSHICQTLLSILMKKTILTILTLTIVHFNVIGQSKMLNNYSVKIDTLSVKSDSVLSKIFTYNDEILIKETTAFLFLDSIQTSRFRLARNLFKKTVYVDRVLKHGKNAEYTEDNNKKITEFKYGTAISSFYYNKNNDEISKEKFIVDKIQIGQCGEVTEEYLIHGQKKKKFNDTIRE